MSGSPVEIANNRARWMARRKVLRADLIEQVTKSSTGKNGLPVKPEQSAEYVANALLVHRPELLAELAILYAAPEIQRMLK